eukprot:scaffold26891_cov95-Amphora_coffeaeformis.AAC.1
MTTTLIVCDVQPDVVNKLEPSEGRLWVDLVALVVQAARSSPNKKMRIVWTQLHFENDGAIIQQIPVTHKRLGVLHKLAAAGRTVSWFTDPKLHVQPAADETVVRRTRLVPHASDQTLVEA